MRNRSILLGIVFSACKGLIFFLQQNTILEEDMRRQKYFNGQDNYKLKVLIKEKTGFQGGHGACLRPQHPETN